MHHFLDIESQNATTLTSILSLASQLKAQRKENHAYTSLLKGQTWAMIFSKASTRTRVSFEVGIRELGGDVMFLSAQDMQLGRGEPIIDTARVLGRMVHGAIIRTFAHKDIEDFAAFSHIPTINALTDDAHPCQILADLLTIQEKCGDLNNLKGVAFIGDCLNNMARSWMWAAKHLNIPLWLSGPACALPSEDFLSKLNAPIYCTTDPKEAMRHCEVINTDVWLSMGQENEKEKEQRFASYQVNTQLLEHAPLPPIVLHCLPAYRGKEITDEVIEAHASTIFQQAENRLHVQKAIVAHCVA